MVTEETSNLSKRIDEICRDKKLTYNKLAHMLGISSTTFYQISSGRTKQLSIDVLIKFYQLLDIDIAWLATGEGSMYGKGERKPEPNFGENVVEQLNARIEELKDQVGHLKYTINLQRKMLEQSEKEVSNLGKSKGVAVGPLSTISMPFEKMMSLYKSAVLQEHGSQVSTQHFFLNQLMAKLVAPQLGY